MHEKHVAAQLKIKEWQVKNTLKLMAEGGTIPFIARYRKEITGNLDEVQLQSIKDEWERIEELEKRRAYILKQIAEQGKLSPELERAIREVAGLEELEDLYLPYKPRRKSRADAAREKALEPIARMIYEQKNDRFLQEISAIAAGLPGGKQEALQGARDIVAEWISEDAVLRSKMRMLFDKEAVLFAKVSRGKKDNPEAQKYRDYFEHTEALHRCPSHRILAISRGEHQGFLKVTVKPDEERALQQMRRHVLHGYSDATEQVKIAMVDSWERLLQPSLESEFLQKARDRADEEAIAVFAANARQLLLAPPLGQKKILAIDPGFRTGCKVVVINENGAYLRSDAIFPHEPQNDFSGAERTILKLVDEFAPEAIAIGNGTAGRETEAFIQKVMGNTMPVYMVNEAGASIYSAGAVAREEFPSLDVTIRGAISIGRRLLDPLAELVKIDPGNIGVGQYQHDVNQTSLKKKLDTVVVSSVNAVGVNLNTASRHLLAYVSGLGPVLAKNIVDYREQLGGFNSRDQLKEVPRLGSRVFEQCAGFLRVKGAKNPLDDSAVHPERYGLVKKIAADLGTTVADLLQSPQQLSGVQLVNYVNEDAGLGLLTLTDIIKELSKPGLDPRGTFVQVGFSDTVRKISDLDSGLELNGIITNITDFGAFVDIGVKQDGLVHISQMCDRFIKHPLEVVSLGQHVKVRVMEVDAQRKRISLTMKFDHA